MTENRKQYDIGYILLFAVFFLGDGLLFLPQKGKSDCIIPAFLISAVLGFFLLLLAVSVAPAIIEKAKYLLILPSAVAVFSLAFTLKGFCEFASRRLLPDTPIIVSVAVFSAVAVYFAAAPYKAVKKFALIFTLASASLILILLIIDEGAFHFDNIYFGDFKKLVPDSIPFWRFSFLPMLVLPFMAAKGETKELGQDLLRGFLLAVVCGCVLLGFVLLLFGASFAGKSLYPFYDAVSTVSVGRLLIRLDSVAYFIILGNCILKSSTLLRAVILFTKELKSA